AAHAAHVRPIGVTRGFAATINPLQILQRSLKVEGIYVGSAEMFRAMNAAFAANRLQPVIDQTFAFKDAPAAFQCMQDAGHFGKIVIRIESEGLADSQLYLEDLPVGRRFTSPTHTVDEAEIFAFARQWDPQPFHTDPKAAEATIFHGLAASGWHTAAITMRLNVASLPFAGGIVG